MRVKCINAQGSFLKKGEIYNVAVVVERGHYGNPSSPVMKGNQSGYILDLTKQYGHTGYPFIWDFNRFEEEI